MALVAIANPNVGLSSPWYQQAWTTTPATYDILLNGPNNPSVSGQGFPCRWITIQTAGTLVVTDVFGNTRTLTCVAGETLWIDAVSLSNTSTAQNVKVFW